MSRADRAIELSLSEGGETVDVAGDTATGNALYSRSATSRDLAGNCTEYRGERDGRPWHVVLHREDLNADGSVRS